MSMENSRDVEDYLQSMLDLSNAEHRLFVENLLSRMGYTHGEPKDRHAKKKSAVDNEHEKGTSTTKGSKKKVKQVNLFSTEGRLKDNIVIPGQHWYFFINKVCTNTICCIILKIFIIQV